MARESKNPAEQCSYKLISCNVMPDEEGWVSREGRNPLVRQGKEEEGEMVLFRPGVSVELTVEVDGKRFRGKEYMQMVCERDEEVVEAIADVLAVRTVDEGGETVPIVSERFLYEAVGKDKARTFLGRFRALCDKVGIPWNNAWAWLYAREEEADV